MKIKKYLNNGGAVFGTNTISYVSGFYGSVPDWLTTQFLNMVAMTIEDDFATRELLQDDTTVSEDLITDVTGRNTRIKEKMRRGAEMQLPPSLGGQGKAPAERVPKTTQRNMLDTFGLR